MSLEYTLRLKDVYVECWLDTITLNRTGTDGLLHCPASQIPGNVACDFSVAAAQNLVRHLLASHTIPGDAASIPCTLDWRGIRTEDTSGRTSPVVAGSTELDLSDHSSVPSRVSSPRKGHHRSFSGASADRAESPDQRYSPYHVPASLPPSRTVSRMPSLARMSESQILPPLRIMTQPSLSQLDPSAPLQDVINLNSPDSPETDVSMSSPPAPIDGMLRSSTQSDYN